jgi:hypothetical protein
MNREAKIHKLKQILSGDFKAKDQPFEFVVTDEVIEKSTTDELYKIWEFKREDGGKYSEEAIQWLKEHSRVLKGRHRYYSLMLRLKYFKPEEVEDGYYSRKEIFAAIEKIRNEQDLTEREKHGVECTIRYMVPEGAKI